MEATWDDLPTSMRSLAWRPLFTMQLQVTSVDAGRTPDGSRRIATVQSGIFTGAPDGPSGTVLPGGVDWITERVDGAVHLDARIVLQTEDGESILMSYRGIRHGSADVLARLARAEVVDPADYYFRIAPRFETGSQRWDRLNHCFAIGRGKRLTDGVLYSVFIID